MECAARLARVLCLLAGLIALSPCCPAGGQDRRGAFTAPVRSVRSRDIDQQHIRLDLRFDWERQQIDATATHRLALFKPLTQITLDAADLQITSTALHMPGEGKPVALKHEVRGQELTLV